MKVWRTVRGKRSGFTESKRWECSWADFSPDDRLLALAYEDGTVRLWRLPEGKPVAPFSGHSPRVGARLVFAQWTSACLCRVRRFRQALGCPRPARGMTLRSYFNHLSALAYSPDGRRLAVTGYSPNTAIKLWDPTTQRELITLEIDKRAIRPSDFTTFSPDGNTLASASANGPMLPLARALVCRNRGEGRKKSPR